VTGVRVRSRLHADRSRPLPPGTLIQRDEALYAVRQHHSRAFKSLLEALGELGAAVVWVTRLRRDPANTRFSPEGVGP
jgi:hypothetical protein